MSPRKHNGIIALDGPAGAGKSTIAKMVAQRLRSRYVDTGAMYRAMAWKAIQEGVPFDSPRALARMASRTKLRFAHRNGAQHILVDGRDATHAIRTLRVTKMTNAVAAVPEVRRVLQRRQKDMGKSGRVVMEGRDIGTRVFPNASFKFYLDASPEERANRRYRELKAKGRRVSLRAVLEAIRRRDHKDKTRRDSPLKAAPDAVVVDTTRMSLHEVADFILDWVKNPPARRHG